MLSDSNERLDEMVFASSFIRDMKPPLSIDLAAHLLVTIITKAGDSLNQTYRDLFHAQSLIENKDYDYLLKDLENALEKKEFSQILSLRK
jgi:hypothetical protein